MSSNERVQLLHVRSATGETLTTAERAELEQWYATMDAAEGAELDAHWRPRPHSTLQDEIAALLMQLQVETRRLQDLTEQNEALRQQIAVLEQRLAEAVARAPR